jgi:GT2 family glycosyltransferase
VDNDSRDGTKEFLDSLTIKKVISEKNRGFGAGVNIGRSMADGAYLFFLNPDTILPPGTLKSLHDFACQNPSAAIISPTIIWPDGKLQPHARHFPSRLDFFFGRGSPLFKLGITHERMAGYIEPSNGPLKAPAVSATALFMISDLFRQLGGFDERFFMYLEDLDFCRRAAQAGYDIWLLPDIRVIHRWRQSSKGRPYFSSYHHHLSVLKYFGKHNRHQFLRNFTLLLALAAGFVVSSLMTLVSRRS